MTLQVLSKSALHVGIFLMASNTQGNFNKSSWIECYCNHCLTMKVTNPNMLLLGDSIIAGLAQYQIVWKKYFVSLNVMNLGTGGDRVENVLWRAISLQLPSSVQNIVVQSRTNNISTDSPHDITDCIVDVGTIFQKKSNTVNIIICGLIPRDKCWSVNRFLVSKVNDILKYECPKNGFVSIVQDYGWTLPNGSLDCSLFYKYSVHLVEQGNVELAKSIVSTFTEHRTIK